MTIVFTILGGWLAMAILMSGLWYYQKVRGDAGIVDVAWGAGVGVLGATFSLLATDGNLWRRIALAFLVLVWASRLSVHIARRLIKLPEDGRYESLKERWGNRAQLLMFGFFQLQAFWSVLFALPIFLAATNPEPWSMTSDGLGLGIWIAAILGETIADRQLQAFRFNPGNRGKVCKEGLWKYSRHPNYFFEWVHWWAYVVFAVSAPYGWLALFGPAVMLWFLTRVTGVPPAEAQALKSRGDAYREYQATTSPFFPWPPRSSGVPR